jgi:hypothetical protein
MLLALRVARLWTLPIGWIRIYTMRAHYEGSVYTVPLSPERISAAWIVLRRWACNSVDSSKVGQLTARLLLLLLVVGVFVLGGRDIADFACLVRLVCLASLAYLARWCYNADRHCQYMHCIGRCSCSPREGLSLQGRVSHCTGPRVDPTTCYADQRG